MAAAPVSTTSVSKTTRAAPCRHILVRSVWPGSTGAAKRARTAWKRAFVRVVELGWGWGLGLGLGLGLGFGFGLGFGLGLGSGIGLGLGLGLGLGQG